jgi:hypothetical protein
MTIAALTGANSSQKATTTNDTATQQFSQALDTAKSPSPNPPPRGAQNGPPLLPLPPNGNPQDTPFYPVSANSTASQTVQKIRRDIQDGNQSDLVADLKSASGAELASVTSSLTSGTEIAAILTAASNAGQINQLLGNLSQSQLDTIAQDLDQLNGYGAPLISLQARSALFSAMTTPSSLSRSGNGGPPIPGIDAKQAARFANALATSAVGGDVATFLTAVSGAGDISSVLSYLNTSDWNTLAKKLEGPVPVMLNDGQVLNDPVDDDQRSTLFNAIAKGGATSQQLADLSNALGSVPDGSPDFHLNKSSWVEALASSVAKFSPDGTKVDYIKGIQPEIETQAGIASSVGTVLASLKGNSQSVNEAFGLFDKSPGELHDVLTANNGTLFTGIVNAAATGTDANTQMNVFGAATQAFRELGFEGNAWGASPNVNALNALTNLIESNPEGIVQSLYKKDQAPRIDSQNALNPPVLPGQTLTDYAGDMFALGQTKQLANLFNQLKSYMDNDSNDTPPNYHAATLLGYFVGAVDQAVANNNADITNYWTFVGDLSAGIPLVGGIPDYALQTHGQDSQSAVAQTLKSAAGYGASQGAQSAFLNELELNWPSSVTQA